MNFRQLIKTIDTNNSYKKIVELKKIKAQYNPERFHLWSALHKGPKQEDLNMIYSPHYRFLLNRKDTSYYQLQKSYGRNKKWIIDKIKKFLDVFESIKKDGFKDNIMIIEVPIFKNKYNKGYEIFEGHHRVACMLALNKKKIPSIIIRRKQ